MKRYLFFHKRTLFFVVLLGIVSGVLNSGIALVLEYLIDDISNPGFTINSFILYGGLSFVYALLMMASFWGYEILLSHYLSSCSQKLRDDLFAAIEKKPVALYRENSTLEWVSHLTNDVNSVANNYFSNWLSLPYYLSCYASALVISILINYYVALLLFGLSFVVFLVPLFFDKKIRETNLLASKRYGELMTFIQEYFMGKEVVTSFDAFESVNEDEKQEANKLRLLQFKGNMLNYSSMSLSGFVITALQLGVIVLTGVLAYQGLLGLGAVLAFIQLASNLYNPLSSFVSSFTAISGMRSVNMLLGGYLENEQKESKKKASPLTKQITLKDVSFSYGDKMIFKGVDVAFEKGKKYLITGASGSGKSSLLSLLADETIPSKGIIYFDEDPYPDITYYSLKKEVYLCEQDSLLFSRSLRENIDFKKEGNDDLLHEVVDKAGLASFIAKRGLDARLDPEKEKTSGGERQRIALARALYSQASILLLDEITASLDDKTATEILKSVLMLDKTIIMASHNVPTSFYSRFDGVFVIENQTIRLLSKS
jgi:ATP-binding cassette, subfamily B, bacterial